MADDWRAWGIPGTIKCGRLLFCIGIFWLGCHRKWSLSIDWPSLPSWVFGDFEVLPRHDVRLDSPLVKFYGGVMHPFVYPCWFYGKPFLDTSNKLLKVGRILDVYWAVSDLFYYW